MEKQFESQRGFAIPTPKIETRKIRVMRKGKGQTRNEDGLTDSAYSNVFFKVFGNSTQFVQRGKTCEKVSEKNTSRKKSNEL